jgi:hypothetical protein
MGEDTREIEREIRAERAELDRNLRELQRQTRDLADWRTHYRNHAGVFLATAVGGGLLLGLLSVPRRSRTGVSRPHVEPHHADWQPAERRPVGATSFQALKAIGNNPRARQQIGETWQQILDTLIAVGSARAIDLLGAYVPGFRQQHESRQHTEEPARPATMARV